jgi:hypothetical protein
VPYRITSSSDSAGNEDSSYYFYGGDPGDFIGSSITLGDEPFVGKTKSFSVTFRVKSLGTAKTFFIRLKSNSTEFIYTLAPPYQADSENASVYMGFRGCRSIISTDTDYHINKLYNQWYRHTITYTGDDPEDPSSWHVDIEGKQPTLSQGTASIPGAYNSNVFGCDSALDTAYSLLGFAADIAIYNRVLNSEEIDYIVENCYPKDTEDEEETVVTPDGAYIQQIRYLPQPDSSFSNCGYARDFYKPYDNIDALHGVLLGKEYLHGEYENKLYFINQDLPTIVSVNSKGITDIKFPIGGLLKDVQKFWEYVDEKINQYGVTLAQLFDLRYDVSDPSKVILTQPRGHALPDTINPMKFIIRHFLSPQMFFILIKDTEERKSELTKSPLSYIKTLLHPTKSYMILTDKYLTENTTVTAECETVNMIAVNIEPTIMVTTSANIITGIYL